ncbi:retrotransposon protein, putative, ty1-copia subclass [Tanacetum coccineum]
MYLYIDAEEHELGDHNEPANYKAALLDPESNKWLDAMNVKMQSMKNNQVWDLVDLLPDDIRAIKILIAIAVFYDYEIWKIDVKTAFLNGHLSEEVYIVQPEGFVNPKYPNRVFSYERSREAAYILGIKIYRDRSKRLIGLCQSAYIDKILKRFYMENSKRGSILMQAKLKLSKSRDASTPAEVKCMQNIPYAIVVGSIMYDVRCTRPDIALWFLATLMLEYLTDADDLKSHTGYVFVLNRGALDWKSTKQSILTTSSAEAEYIAAYDASKEAVWIRKFIYGLGIVPTIKEPIRMYYDNTKAITIANESGITKVGAVGKWESDTHVIRPEICEPTGVMCYCVANVSLAKVENTMSSGVHAVKQENLSDEDLSGEDSPKNLYITVKVTSQMNELDPYFRVRRDEPLKQLMIRWCARSDVGDYKSILFLFDGNRINEKKTPDEFGIEDGDCIDAIMDQTSG